MSHDADDVQDATGVLPIQRPGLSDLLAGKPELPYAFLVVLTGDARGTTLVVDSLPAELGRSPEVDLVLVDDTVSRRHAELRRDGARWLLRDLGSRNGTRVNGVRLLDEAEVRAGDRVSFGDARFRLGGAPRTAAT